MTIEYDADWTNRYEPIGIPRCRASLFIVSPDPISTIVMIAAVTEDVNLAAPY
jgi:hypothetical protein